MSEQKNLSLQAVYDDLKAGLSRKEIKEKYGMNPKAYKDVFSNPKLKSVRKSFTRPSAASNVVINDDLVIPEKKVKAVKESEAGSESQAEQSSEQVQAASPAVEETKPDTGTW